MDIWLVSSWAFGIKLLGTTLHKSFCGCMFFCILAYTPEWNFWVRGQMCDWLQAFPLAVCESSSYSTSLPTIRIVFIFRDLSGYELVSYWVWIHISLITNAEYLLRCLHMSCASSFAKCLLKSFPLFKSWIVGLSVINV